MKQLLRLVLRGLWGRKRDSAILGSILLLAFLFLTLSSILLASFTRTAELRRQELHGKWQVMYYGANETAQAQCAAFADCGAIELVGTTKGNHLIGSIDEAVRSIGGLRLTEGRLPAGEDEIVLVQGRMDTEPALGEEFETVYQYSYMRGGSKLFNDWENRKKAVVSSLRAGVTDPDILDQSNLWEEQQKYFPDSGAVNPYNPVRSWEELHGEFLTYVREHYASDGESGSYIRFVSEIPYGTYAAEKPYYDYILPPGYDLERILQEDEDTLLYEWATKVLYSNYQAWHIGAVRTLPGNLFSYEGFLINIHNEGVETVYSGFAYSDEVRKQHSVQLQTADTLLYKTYTVVGYVAPYADHWDARGLTLPDGFVSHEAAAAQLRALRRAEEEYYEGAPCFEPSAILLLQDPNRSWKQTAARALAVFSEVQRPYFKLEGFEEETVGVRKGFLIGLDPETGAEKLCELEQYGSVGYFLTDPATRSSFAISGDPRSEIRWDEFSSVLLPLQPEQMTLEELEENNTHPLRLNQYSFPPSGSTEQSMQTLCSGVLIGVAACAVFQVFWVQLRRRRMRLTTLMAVGATDGQVLSMLLLEIGVLLLGAGILGAGLGFALARILTAQMGTVFTVEPRHLFGGMALCAAAVLVSALIPMLLVLQTPLTGREQLSRHTLRLKAPQKQRRQSYARIVLRQMRVNRGRTALQAVMAFLLAAICLLTVFLCHGAYAGVRRRIEDTAMPDYEIKVPYGMSQRFLREVLEQHGALTEAAEISVSREAPNVWLHCGGLLETSPIVRAMSGLPEIESRELPGGETGMAVRVIGLEEDALAAFCERLPENTVDQSAMLAGESCVVLLPRFEAENGVPMRREAEQTALSGLRTDERAGYLLALHYGGLYADVTEADESLRPGDMLTLTAFSQKISDEYLKEDEKTLSLRVGAVVSALEPPLWPLSENDAAFVIVTGQRAIPALYPFANTHMTAAKTRYHLRMAELFYPDCYGLTRLVISGRPDADPTATDTAAYDLAEELGVELVNYRMTKEREESAAQNRLLLYLLLGIEMALVLCTLLYSAAGMAAEQDRFRVGLLQGIGLTDGQLFLGQLLQSLGLALVGCAAANALMALVQLAAALLSRRPGLTLLENFEGYPWSLHLLVCLGFVLVYTLLQSLPIRRLGRAGVIENMRS